jgi:hypothetical protein
MEQPTDQHCPYCGVRIKLILSADGDDAAASDGNTLLCMVCNFVSVFNEDLQIVKLTYWQEDTIKAWWKRGLYPYPPKPVVH